VGLRALKPPVQGLPEQAAEASKTRLQTAMRGLGTQGPVAPTQIAAAGAEAVQTQAKAQLAAQEQQAQLAVRQTELGLQTQARAQQAALQNRKTALNTSLRNAEQALASLGATTKQQLFDATIQFEQDELGRTLFNERQLLDYAATHAKSVEDLYDYEQTITQMSERKLRLMEAAQKRLELELTQAYEAEQSALNQEAKLALARLTKDMKEKIAKEKADAANRSAIWTGVGTLVGAGIGAVLAVPTGGMSVAAGASLGASIGSSLGGAASAVD
jgi:hypothetical protein